MQKVGLYLLTALLAFSVIFALLPATDRVAAKTGATLQDVELTLYAARDPDAIWRFKAANVTSDPISSTTELRQLSGGERLLRQKDAQGRYTGQEKLDATLSAPQLSIDGQDDIVTDSARLTFVADCTYANLKGNASTPVRIQQGVGFSAPTVMVDMPGTQVEYQNLQMDFQFNVITSGPMKVLGDLDSQVQCVNGKRV